MYIPTSNLETRRPTLFEFMRRNSFAVLIAHARGETVATHLPVMLEEGEGENGTLYAHVARVNPHAKMLNQEALCVFSGPHAYISPTWYEVKNAVPTWNYAAVHAYGTPRELSEEELRVLLGKMVETYEAGFEKPWKMDLSPEYEAGLLKAIVGFKIPITKLEGKWKLSQNRTRDEQARVIAGLNAQTDENAREVARMMDRNLNAGGK